MRLGQGPCVVWAWGPAFADVCAEADISGRPDGRWQWITINHGRPRGIRRGSFLEVTRRGRRVAVAEVERSDEKRAVAWILEGTMGKKDEPRLGDDIRILA